METSDIEYIAALTGIIVTDTLAKLGLIQENISEPKAFKLYTKKLIDKLRERKWINAYPSANKVYAKIYYKRSEIEIGIRMLECSSAPLKNNRIKQIIQVIETQVNSHLENKNGIPGPRGGAGTRR